MQRGYYEKRNGHWSVRYSDTAGRYRRQGGFSTKAKAADWLRRRLEEQRDGLKHDPTMTFRRLGDMYVDQHSASEARIANMGYMLKLAYASFGDVTLMDLTPQQIGRWRATLSEGTRHEALAAVKQVLKAAVDWGFLLRSPAASLSNPRPKRREFAPFEDWDEVDALDAAMPEPYRGIAAFAVGTGLRPQEWTKLEWQHVDLAGRVINLPAQIAKDKRPRKIPLRQRVIDILVARDGTRGAVFVTERGLPIDIRNFRSRVWYPAQERVNAERAEQGLEPRPAHRPYDARHTYATWSLRAGLNTFSLSRRMGTSIQMIDESYGHFATDSDTHELLLMDAFDGRALGVPDALPVDDRHTQT